MLEGPGLRGQFYGPDRSGRPPHGGPKLGLLLVCERRLCGRDILYGGKAYSGT